MASPLLLVSGFDFGATGRGGSAGKRLITVASPPVFGDCATTWLPSLMPRPTSADANRATAGALDENAHASDQLDTNRSRVEHGIGDAPAEGSHWISRAD
jgi:hypothetical protein